MSIEVQASLTEAIPAGAFLHSKVLGHYFHAIKYPEHHGGYRFNPVLACFESGWEPELCEPFANPFTLVDEKVDRIQGQFKSVGEYITDISAADHRVDMFRLICGASTRTLHGEVLSSVDDVLPPARVINSMFRHWIDHTKPIRCIPLENYIVRQG